MLSTQWAAPALGMLLAISHLAQADTEALWFEPSQKWYGIDGNWSSMSISVGTPPQQVDVSVSTCLSELWVVETAGCGPSALCTAARGNLFNINASSSWSSVGLWGLGLGYLGLKGNGDYATEAVAVYNSVTQHQTSLAKQVVGAINTTDYYTGFFGVGITAGNFGNTVEASPLARLVERDGLVPSHTYGYTAGAYYRGSSGTPMSLTLGGYDQNRFVPHSTTFSLNSKSRLPDVRLRGITASVSSTSKAPTKWDTTSRSLMSFNESVTALIDSSTPYLWLPTTVCDHFADALNLTWNETFGLYLFSNDATYQSFLQPDLSFTFSLSSADNLDNFGKPLEVAGVVNITISANAFAQTLRYPFMDHIPYGAPAVPYFPLKRTADGSQMIIGRSFLQEAYLKMNYEAASFSVHQALFPQNPSDISISTVKSSANNPYPAQAGTPNGQHGLGTSAIVGIAIGASVLMVALIMAVWWRQRRRNSKRRAAREQEEIKDCQSSVDSEPPRTPIRRMFSRFTRRSPRRRSRTVAAHEVAGDVTQPVEAQGAERFEMAAAAVPIELDATDAHSINGTTELGTEGTEEISHYEMARRKMERQLQGPVPQYTPSASPLDSPLDGVEKGFQDVSPVPHYRPSQRSARSNNTSLSPASTPTRDDHSYGIPSPMTPHGDWPPNRIPDIPSSHMMFNHPTSLDRSLSNPGSNYTPPSPSTFDQQSMTRSASSSGSRTGNHVTLAYPSPAIQRTPIDPSKVVCLGPLPSNIRPPRPGSLPRAMGAGGHTFALPTIPSAAESRRQSIVESRRQSTAESRRHSVADTLGSDFTVEMEEQMDGLEHSETFGHHTILEEESGSDTPASTLDGYDLIHIPQPTTPVFATPSTDRLEGRTDLVHIPTPVDPDAVPSSAAQRIAGGDLVHVPQPATKRYSWEQ